MKHQQQNANLIADWLFLPIWIMQTRPLSEFDKDIVPAPQQCFHFKKSSCLSMHIACVRTRETDGDPKKKV